MDYLYTSASPGVMLNTEVSYKHGRQKDEIKT